MIQRRKDESFALSQLSGAFFFIAFAALLWLIIKLSANYTVTVPLCVNFNNPPSELIITDGAESQTLNVTLSANGFDLLNYYFKRISKRKVDISLEEVPLHKESEGTYSVGSYYVKERIANLLKMDSQEVSLNENKLFLNMQKLDSKRVKLSANIDITYDKQYNRHGKIQIEPDSITLYGPENIIKDIDVIYTDKVSLKNVNSSIDIEVPIHFENLLNSDTKTANIKIEVEKYTEAVVNVPVKNNSKLNLRLFPDKVKVKYIVSLTDYSIINENHFNIIIDSADINSDNNLIPIYLIDYPNNTKITSIEPKQLEYIIIEEDEN